MNKVIKLSLIKGKILESVKNETFFRGQVVKAADQAAITEAYHEQAGDDAYQERLLERGLYSNLSQLKTFLSDYLVPNNDSTADNISHTEQNGTIIITMYVSDRFNNAYVDPLAKLCSKYIEDSMLVDWWRPVNEKQAAMYQQFVERGRIDIQRCFNKLAPTAPSVPYTSSLEVSREELQVERGKTKNILYRIDNGVIDDINAFSVDPTICTVVRRDEGTFVVTGGFLGNTYVRLVSKHDDSISASISVKVVEVDNTPDIDWSSGGCNHVIASRETVETIIDELV